MAVVLNPKSLGKGNTVNLSTIQNNKLRRVNRVRDDLDHYFIETETQNRSQYLGVPYIDLYGFPIDTAHLSMIPRDMAVAAQIGIFTINNKVAYLASYDLQNPAHLQIFNYLAGKGLRYKLFLCSHLSFKKLINTYDNLVDVRTVNDEISLSQQSLDNNQKNQSDLQNLSDILNQVSVSEAIETVLSAALQNDASDIHFEPEKETYILRLRLDGVLHTFANLPKDMQKTIESRLKIISGLKLNVDNVPQDGRFSFRAGDKDIDVRVSMLPSNYGYSIVMRLLGTGSIALELDQLGFSGLAKERVQSAITKPQGMILTTGPTGSGKTTTLYTFLKDLNDGQSKIITLEDPIEYKLPGVSQTQIDTKAGYTFGSGLRSILRQDPDVVMVGEIRDPETAEIAVQAALTGHQVLSTLHTNDAAGTIPRLLEMNIKGYLLADSLAAVIGQRLVRRLCQNCKKPDTLSADQQKFVYDTLGSLPPSANVSLPNQLNFFTATGCNQCNGLGYRGRVGAYEVMTVTRGLRDLLSDQYPSIMQVRDIAAQEGMLTMAQDALLKALDGLTDIKEIMRNIT